MLVTNKIVADQLNFAANLLGQHFPAIPVVFGKAVFDGNDGIVAAPIWPRYSDHVF